MHSVPSPTSCVGLQGVDSQQCLLLTSTFSSAVRADQVVELKNKSDVLTTVTR